MSDCIFCKIAQGEIPTEFLYEDDKVVAFKDLYPQAPVHILIVPKAHFDNFAQCNDAQTLVSMNKAVDYLAKKFDLTDKGYRLIMNTGEDAGQTVMHLHMHLLAGKHLGEHLI